MLTRSVRRRRPISCGAMPRHAVVNAPARLCPRGRNPKRYCRPGTFAVMWRADVTFGGAEKLFRAHVRRRSRCQSFQTTSCNSPAARASFAFLILTRPDGNRDPVIGDKLDRCSTCVCPVRLQSPARADRFVPRPRRRPRSGPPRRREHRSPRRAARPRKS